MTRRVMAELVTDDDFDVAVRQAKQVETAPERLDDDDETATPNPVFQFTLRSLDVVFLVIEKTATVRSNRCNAMPCHAMPVCQFVNGVYMYYNTYSLTFSTTLL